MGVIERFRVPQRLFTLCARLRQETGEQLGSPLDVRIEACCLTNLLDGRRDVRRTDGCRIVDQFLRIAPALFRLALGLGALRLGVYRAGFAGGGAKVVPAAAVHGGCGPRDWPVGTPVG